MGWPFHLGVKPEQQPDVAEIANAFNEGAREVAKDLTEDLPAEIATWNRRHTVAAAFAFVMFCGTMFLLGVIYGKAERPPVRQDVVTITAHNAVRLQLERRTRDLEAMQASLDKSAWSNRQMQLQITTLETQLTAAMQCGRPDDIIDSLNRKAASR